MGIRDHQNKVRILKAGKAHGVCDRPGGPETQVFLSLANILQIDCRRKTGRPRKIAPRKRGTTLALIVVILDVLTIIGIFDNLLHMVKYRFFEVYLEYKISFFG